MIERYVNSFAGNKLYQTVESVPAEDQPRVAVIFGAGVTSDGRPMNALYDRVLVGVELYRAGRVRKLLMTGDNSRKGYDEPTVMKNTAMEMGVPEQDIVLDFAGRRTYDSCYRAREIFDVKRAVIVTQGYHQARALYLCSNFGIDSIGVDANRRTYDRYDYWQFREVFSIVSAWWEMNFVPFTPIGGEKQPIEL